MKNQIIIKTGAVILFALSGFCNTVDAQCSFEVNTEVKSSTCVANGIITVTLSGDEIDLSNVFISLTNGIINEQSSENGHQFGTLPPGNYTVTAQSVCKNTQNTVTRTATVTIASEYTGLNATPVNTRNSLNCINSGMVVIDTKNGRLPYKMEVTQKPAGYTGETQFTISSSGTITFDNLAPGDYEFTFVDDCSYSIPVTVTIEKITGDFPSNPYSNTLSPSGCNQAYFPTYIEYHEYWTTYRDFYEIAFTFDDTDTKNWQPAVNGYVYIDLPKPYRELYADNAKVKVYLRIKDTECERFMTELQFQQLPTPEIYSYVEKTCDNYKLNFYLSDESSLCQPFKWEIFNESNELVNSDDNLENFGTQIIDGLLYNKNYTLKVTDKNGTEVVSTIRYERDAPYVNALWTASHSLLTYDLFYDMAQICLPYKIEVYEKTGGSEVFLTTIEDISTTSNTIRGLEYGKIYTIKIVDNFGNVVQTFDYAENKPAEILCNEDEDDCAITYYCNDYSFRIDKPVNINTPFTWSVMDNDGNVLQTGNESNRVVTGLKYETDYTVIITDGVNTVESTLNVNLLTPYFFDINEFGYSCNDYKFGFRVKHIVCYPYKLEILDENRTVLKTETGFADPDEYHTVTLDYDKWYIIKITSEDGRQSVERWYRRDNDLSLSPNFEYTSIFDEQCSDYGFEFKVLNVFCFPYKFEVFDNDSDDNTTPITESEDFDELQEYHQVRLEYNRNYTIKISDSKGASNVWGQRLDKESSGFSFNSNYSISDCASDLHKGYIYLEGRFDADTRVSFVSGPQRPVHTDVTLSESLSRFYPFSTDYRNQEDVPMTAGDYVFKIINRCEDIFEVTVHCVPYSQVRDFSYISDDISDICNNITRVYPKGRIYRNEMPVQTWFVMANSPVPSIIGHGIYGGNETSYFSLSNDGRYVIEIRNEYSGCAFDSIVIDHKGKAYTLDGRSSYVCETGSTGHIRVQAKDGKPPYTYTLYDEEMRRVEGVAPNNDGAFEYGAFAEKYIVVAEDACRRSFQIPVQINTIDPTALLSPDKHICQGETLELSCLLLGATTYKWSGPLGFTADTRTVSIPNVTTKHSGSYTVEVKPAGCDVFFSDAISIEVYGKSVSDISDPYTFCKSSTANSLSIEPSDGHTIQWYDKWEEPMDEAPVIDPDNDDEEYVFYVSQTDNIYNCVSEKTRVNVKISPPPAQDATANGWSCENEHPEITVTNIVDGYGYTVFSDSEATNPVMTFTGTAAETMSMDLPGTVTDDTVFYLQTATPSGCISLSGAAALPVDVTKITVSPDRLPVYVHDIPYRVQLASNAGEPEFSYTGNLVTGISMTQSGLISGTVPESSGREESTFVVTVVDQSNGCKTSREYVLRTCEPAPDLQEDTIKHCQGVQVPPIQASPVGENILQWYDAELNELTGAPVLNTAVAGEQTFYVSQINETLQCESPAAKVTVLIKPAPVVNFTASTGIVCAGDPPSILLEHLKENYSYHVYSDNTFAHERGSLTGVSSGTVNTENILNDNTVYYIRVTDSVECTSLDCLEVPIEVLKLNIEPEKLSPYHKNVEYEQILLTNARTPVFTVAGGELPAGLLLTASGTIYGTVPSSEYSVKNVFTVQVQDSNGCTAVREYILYGNVYVPEAFTPNGDGLNDIFMQSYKLTVFDRLGMELYKGESGWDGTYKGKKAAQDIYFYKLEYMDGDGSAKILTGYVGVHY